MASDALCVQGTGAYIGEGSFTGEGYYYGGDGLLYGTGVLQGSGECETGEVEVLPPSAPLPSEIASILASRSTPLMLHHQLHYTL